MRSSLATLLVVLALAGPVDVRSDQAAAVAPWPYEPTPFYLTPDDDAFLEDLQKRSFLFFWEQADPATGIVRDRAGRDGGPSGNERSREVGSIAAVGFGLSGMCVAAERAWRPREEIVERTRNTLRFFAERMPHHRGWFYHFVDLRTGEREWNSELSSIDTALLLAGALTVKQCFAADGDIVRYADAVYRRIDFPWMLDGSAHLLSMGWRPEQGFIKSRWDHHCELMALYLMATGSSTHPIPAASWRAWTRPWIAYGGYRFVSGAAPLFVHQFSHAWVDFRGRREREAPYIDWFENSVLATRAHKQFCLDLSREFPSYGDDLWGITSSDSAKGYAAWGGPPRTDAIDGSVVPCAAAGSLMLAPDIALPALRAMRQRFGDRIYGRYGFADAFHPATGWVDGDVIGIDLGISLLSAENLRTGAVWRWFMANREIQAAMDAVGLLRVPPPAVEYRVVPPYPAGAVEAASGVLREAERIPVETFEAGEFHATNGIRLPYRLLRPTETPAAATWPLVVVFHGSGEIGTDNRKHMNSLVKVWARPEVRRQFPAFVAAPQFPERSSSYSGPVTERRRVSRPAPPLVAALELVDHLRTTLPVDAERIYATGFSMGASATWNALGLRPGLFAAAVPVAGVPNPADAARVAATPVWVLHGSHDAATAIAHERVMYERFRRCEGAQMRFWEFADLGHVVPPPLLAGVELQRWLFAHRRTAGAPAQRACGP